MLNKELEQHKQDTIVKANKIWVKLLTKLNEFAHTKLNNARLDYLQYIGNLSKSERDKESLKVCVEKLFHVADSNLDSHFVYNIEKNQQFKILIDSKYKCMQYCLDDMKIIGDVSNTELNQVTKEIDIDAMVKLVYQAEMERITSVITDILFQVKMKVSELEKQIVLPLKIEKKLSYQCSLLPQDYQQKLVTEFIDGLKVTRYGSSDVKDEVIQRLDSLNNVDLNKDWDIRFKKVDIYRNLFSLKFIDKVLVLLELEFALAEQNTPNIFYRFSDNDYIDELLFVVLTEGILQENNIAFIPQEEISSTKLDEDTQQLMVDLLEPKYQEVVERVSKLSIKPLLNNLSILDAYTCYITSLNYCTDLQLDEYKHYLKEIRGKSNEELFGTMSLEDCKHCAENYKKLKRLDLDLLSEQQFDGLLRKIFSMSSSASLFFEDYMDDMSRELQLEVLKKIKVGYRSEFVFFENYALYLSEEDKEKGAFYVFSKIHSGELIVSMSKFYEAYKHYLDEEQTVWVLTKLMGVGKA